VLYVARHAQTAFVRPYDLDGRPLARGFSFRGDDGASCAIEGIDVDSDRQVWAADTTSGCVRAFNLFGVQTACLRGAERAREDSRGVLRSVVDVIVRETDEARTVTVASRGWRRHAVQTFDMGGACLGSLRPGGDPLARFREVHRIAAHGRFTYVCEFGAGQVQVFRDDEHHFSFRPVDARGAVTAPAALAPLSDGRLVIACGAEDARLLLTDASGRLIRELARTGGDSADIRHPGDVAVESGGGDDTLRIALMDDDAERVQVFTLDGACHGELPELPGHAVGELE